MKLVYVCHNGKGRSIAFREYTRYFLGKGELKMWRSEVLEVRSSGVGKESIDVLREREMDKASRTVINILDGHGFNVEDYRLNYLGEIIQGSDLVVASDHYTLERAKRDFPKYEEIIFLARSVAGFKRGGDVSGPYCESR